MTTQGVDSVLLNYVQVSDSSESEHLLSSLITEHAEPIITKIINYKMRGARRGGGSQHLYESEDIRGEVMLQLVRRLQDLRIDHDARPITDFPAYVAVVTYNAYDRYISRKYPQRRRLKNGLRYLLTHRPGLALWRTEHDAWVGGLSAWRVGTLTGGGAARGDEDSQSAERLQRLRDDARAFACDVKIKANFSDPKAAYELLNAIFAWTNAPVELDLLTGVIAEWWGVTDQAVEIDATGEQNEAAVPLPDKSESVFVEAERRAYLKRLWDEIADLPPRQRAALLLNLRDEEGRGVIDLWMLTGLATPEIVAQSLDLTVAEFAALWNELPLDDNRIAAHLSLTRQQVINLRKSARERLARRMKEF